MRLRIVFLLSALVLVASSPAAAGGSDPVVLNPGFESDSATQTPSGWTELSGTGHESASFVEWGGRDGTGYRLSHWADTPYTVETVQRLTGLANGQYTLRLWVKSGGGQNSVSAALQGCDSKRPSVNTSLPVTGGTDWVQIVVGTRVTTHRCTIVLSSDAPANAWANFDDISFTRTALAPIRIHGGDVSTLKKNEDHGAVYFDQSGHQRDALSILDAAGMNYARLKVWVNPADGYNNKARVLEMAKRLKKLGVKIYIDFHYSDSWADPGKQNKPAAWAALPFDQLKQAVYDHTYDVLLSLRQQGTPADLVQIGNEINGGLLWPDGRWDNWDGLAALLTAGSTAAKAASPGIRVALHLAEGGNNGGHRWWFDNAVARGVPFDVIAVSHYVFWHGSLGSLQFNLIDLAARYGKPVLVAETAYGFTTAEKDFEPNIFNPSLEQAGGYPATPRGQAQAFRDMFTVVNAVPDGRGLGVVYWEPTWTAVPGGGWDPTDPNSGDGWENQAMFDYRSRALPVLSVFGEV